MSKPLLAFVIGVGVLILVAVIAAAVSSGGDKSSEPGAAFFLSPGGSDSNPCSAAAPCKTLQRGYNVASPGQTVSVAAGTYPSQTLSYSAAKLGAASRVVFQCAPSFASVIGGGTSGVEMHGAQHVELVGCDLRGDSGGTALNRSDPASPRVTDVVIRDGRMQSFHITSVNGFQILNNDIGHYNYANGFGSNSIYQDIQPTSTNVVVRGNTFRDIITGAGGGHAECLFLKGVNGVQIDHNKMLGCPGLAIAWYDITAGGGPGPYGNVTIENNFLDCATGNESLGNGCYGDGGSSTGGGLAVEMSTKSQGPISNLTFKFNTLRAHGSAGGLLIDDPALWTGSNVVVGNIAAGICTTGSTWRSQYNVTTTSVGACPTNVHVASLAAVVDGSMHLLAGSPAIDVVPAAACATCPATDIDAGARPTGSALELPSRSRPSTTCRTARDCDSTSPR